MSETTLTQQWICESCGFIYDPEEGDPDGGVPAGTAFQDIPDDWVCPDCGVGMNRHAEKVDYAATLADRADIDPDFGGVIEEAHTCPECGQTHTRRAGQ